jgi:WS/DGAT/MGAT family acyltransferase
VLIARLHSSPIDFHRPPWEVHLIEGLEGGRFAMFIKIHHSLVDGFTGTRLLARSLSTDPNDTSVPLFFATPPKAKSPRADVDTPEIVPANFSTMMTNLRAQLGSVANVGKAMLELARSRGQDKSLVSSLQAPNSILNGRVGRARRVATQQYPLEQVKDLRRRTGGTLNDVVLALCAGSLRRFLTELDCLPEKPLVAALPVSVRTKDSEGGGNSVGAILASLATDIEDPEERMEAIIASTTRAKEQLSGLSQNAVLAYSAMLMAPFGVQSLQAVTGFTAGLPLTFNVGVSNVPGPTEPLYFRGARLEAVYPISTVGHGMALNITVNSYADTLNFGFVGCRDRLPHLQRLAVYTGAALAELDNAF